MELISLENVTFSVCNILFIKYAYVWTKLSTRSKLKQPQTKNNHRLRRVETTAIWDQQETRDKEQQETFYFIIVNKRLP